jgi:hypothetical protein
LVATGTILLALAASAFRVYPFSSRLIIFLTPIVLLILAAGVEELDRRVGVAASGLLSISLIAIAGFTATRIAMEPVSFSDMRGALEKTRGRIEEGDAVIGGRLNLSLIQFYRRSAIPANVPVFSIQLNKDADLVVDIARKHGFRRVWFVAGHRVAEADRLIEETERAAPIIFKWSARGGRLALFDFSNSFAAGRPNAPGANKDAEKQAEDDASSEGREPPTAGD